jgi:hypothetical protein
MSTSDCHWKASGRGAHDKSVCVVGRSRSAKEEEEERRGRAGNSGWQGRRRRTPGGGRHDPVVGKVAQRLHQRRTTPARGAPTPASPSFALGCVLSFRQHWCLEVPAARQYRMCPQPSSGDFTSQVTVATHTHTDDRETGHACEHTWTPSDDAHSRGWSGEDTSGRASAGWWPMPPDAPLSGHP